MSLKKRLRVLWAAWHQEWHQDICSECGASWWATGPDRPELIRVCDACEVENLNAFMAFAEAEYQRVMSREERRH